jgi:sugar/nucleoside kinase (ribokinase family)
LKCKSGQSHVGTIRIQEGGSARNVAECVGRLGLEKDCTFISAVGEDSEKSDIIFNSLRKVNLVSLY